MKTDRKPTRIQGIKYIRTKLYFLGNYELQKIFREGENIFQQYFKKLAWL